MLVLAILISLFVAIFVLRKIISIWRRSQAEKKRSEQLAILQQV